MQPVQVATRAQAIDKVRSGEVLGALIVPADATRKLQDAINLAGTAPPTVEVLYNADDPIRAQLAESTIKARLADANKALSDKLTRAGGALPAGAAQGRAVLDPGPEVRRAGPGALQGGARAHAAHPAAELRAGRATCSRSSTSPQIAIENLGLSDKVLAAVGQPLAVKRTVIAGHRTPLDAFAVSVSVTVSLMFITVLLASGMLALEREEHAFGRLVRGLVSRLALLGEKVLLAATCAFAVTLVMLCGIGIFVHLDWGRFGLWLVALAGGAIGFGALGVAIGALAREVRAASLLAFLLTLPMAFLALVPAGTRRGLALRRRSAPSRRCSPSAPPCRRSTRRSTTPSRGWGRRWRTSRSSPSPTWRSPAWRCARFR